MATDEELRDQREQVEKLRQQLADNQADREQSERELSNDITMTQLLAEEARLRVRLAEDAKTAKVVESGAAAPLVAAKDDMIRAMKMQQAVAGVVTEKKAESKPTPAPVPSTSSTAPPASSSVPGPSATKTDEKGK